MCGASRALYRNVRHSGLHGPHSINGRMDHDPASPRGGRGPTAGAEVAGAAQRGIKHGFAGGDAKGRLAHAQVGEGDKAEVIVERPAILKERGRVPAALRDVK